MKEKLKKEEVGFAQVRNDILCSNNLSFKAKGLYSYLYSKPDDWDFSSERIALETKDGVDSVKKGLKELEEVGLLVRMRTSTGRVEYCVYCSIKPKKPKVENPTKGKSHKGKIHRISNKDNIQIKNNTNKDAVSYETAPESYKSKYDIAKQKGIKLKPQNKSPKQEQVIARMKLVDHYKNKAYDYHGKEYFKHPDDISDVKKENTKTAKLIKDFYRRCDFDFEKAKSVIDYFLESEDYSWSDYKPGVCFRKETVQEYENQKKKPEMLIYNN